MEKNRRVVITGMGIWSCIGESLDQVKESLYEGRSGIGIDPARKEIGYRSALTGIVRVPDLKGKVDRRQRLCLPEEGKYAFMATEQALAQAGIDKEFLAAREVGILYGNDMADLTTERYAGSSRTAYEDVKAFLEAAFRLDPGLADVAVLDGDINEYALKEVLGVFIL